MKNCGNCGECAGCGSTLELTGTEVALLDQLAQFAFLPVCRRAEDMTPMYFEDSAYSPEEYSAALLLLERKRLISIDYGAPLGRAHPGYPVRGSIALTQRGQQVVEQLQLQGMEP